MTVYCHSSGPCTFTLIGLHRNSSPFTLDLTPIILQGRVLKTVKLLSPFLVDDQPFENVELELNQGTIRGRRLENVDIYRGVPYANPPVRFEMPVAVDPWSGVKDALNFGPTCYQTYINPVLQNTASEEAKGNVSEDCLTVDIYIPRNSTRAQKGILYWIHGGGYQSGDVQELAIFMRPSW